jgi:hypothetical protein
MDIDGTEMLFTSKYSKDLLYTLTMENWKSLSRGGCYVLHEIKDCLKPGETVILSLTTSDDDSFENNFRWEYDWNEFEKTEKIAICKCLSTLGYNIMMTLQELIIWSD